LHNLKIIAAVSEDIDIRNQESTIWGIFTRFDCESDVIFTEQNLIGISQCIRESWESMQRGKKDIRTARDESGCD